MSQSKSTEALLRLIGQHKRVLRQLDALMTENVRLIGNITNSKPSFEDESAVRLGYILDAIEKEILGYPADMLSNQILKAEALFDIFLNSSESSANSGYVTAIKKCFKDMRSLPAAA